jgi:hypothetical protein
MTSDELWFWFLILGVIASHAFAYWTRDPVLVGPGFFVGIKAP